MGAGILISLILLIMRSGEHADEDQNRTGDPCPENRLVISFQMLWNNRMHNKQQSTNGKGHASVEPKINTLHFPLPLA